MDTGSALTFVATATDPDLPTQKLTFTMAAGGPEGASITPDGVFTWTPTELQGPSTNLVTIRVSDGVVSAWQYVRIIVNKVNRPPVLAAIRAKTVSEGSLLTFTATATDPDLPPQALTFTLDAGAPAGASITADGLFSWIPSEAQGPSTNLVTVRVADDGTPPLSATNQFTVVVREANTAPVLVAVADQSLDELTPLDLILTATDSDLPTNALAFALVDGPSGLTVSSEGQVSWTPSEAQGPSTNLVTVRVADDGTPPLSNTRSFTVAVLRIGQPLLVSPGLVAGHFSVAVQTTAGHSYVLEYTESLAAAAWEALPAIAGDGSQKILTDPAIVGTQRFYRMRVE